MFDPERIASIVAELRGRLQPFASLGETARHLREQHPGMSATAVAQALLQHAAGRGPGSVSAAAMTLSAAGVLPPPDPGPLAIAVALKDAGFSAAEIAPALIAAGVYPGLTALQVGTILIDPTVYPATTRDQMSTALLGAPFPAADVTAALAQLYPAPANPFVQAPLLTGLGASQSGGGLGAYLWGIDPTGAIWSAYQLTPGGTWSPWSGPNVNHQPFVAKQVAAAGQNTGALELWALDGGGMLWAAGQQGGGWAPWAGPNFNGQPGPLQYVAAAEQKGNRGVELWAVDANGAIWTIYQVTPGGAWSKWEGPGFKGQPAPAKQVVAAGQNNGNVYVWAMDAGGALRGISQGSPGGDWGPWTGPNIGGQPGPFVQIAASQQGGSRGVEVWGIDGSGRIWTLYQRTAGGPWSSWEGPGFKNQPVPMAQLAASQQSNGCCQLFTLDAKNQIWTITQGSPGGDWGPWLPAGGTRLPPLDVPVAGTFTVPGGPPPPAGLWQNTTPFGSHAYPILTWRGYTYWPLSYTDNRMSLGVVAYDSGGNAVRTIEVGGTRYVGTIAVDPAAHTVTFTGQSGTATIPWSALTVPPH